MMLSAYGVAHVLNPPSSSAHSQSPLKYLTNDSLGSLPSSILNPIVSAHARDVALARGLANASGTTST
jgi:hypothetical protein